MDMNDRLDLFEVIVGLNSSSKAARSEAYSTLVALGDNAIDPLVEMFPQIEGIARLEVIKAFGKIGDERAAEVLTSVVRSQDPNEVLFAQSMAARSLGEIGAVDALTTLLADENNTVRRMAATVFRHIESEDAVPALGTALEDDDPQVVKLAVAALQQIGTPHALALLDRHRTR